jgi:hypothetical protein
MTRTCIVLLLFLVAACAVGPDDEPGDGFGNPPGTAGGEDNTFDHDNNADVDPFELLDRLQQEGPPKYSARLHGCTKPRIRTIGTILASLGVDVNGGGPMSAGDLYRTGYNALGGANYRARIRENIEVTTSGASRLFDIFVQAAPEIIANLPSLPQCQIGGVGVQLFNASNQCLAEGLTCLLGVPATAQHVELCNYAVANAADVESGKRIAVASLLAAINTCE